MTLNNLDLNLLRISNNLEILFSLYFYFNTNLNNLDFYLFKILNNFKKNYFRFI